MEPHVIALDVGGTKIAGALVTQDGQILDRRLRPTPAQEGGEAVAAAVVAVAADLYTAGGRAARAIGVGAAGQIDSAQGTIRHAVDTLPGWAGIPLAARLQAIIPVPTVIENDVNAMALGEQFTASEKAIPSALFVAVGTGIGGALILNGHLWHGAHWSAGELGHILVDITRQRRCNCGLYGHLEAYASGPAIATAVDGSTDLRGVVARAQAGDDRAQKGIAQGAEILGAALNGLVCAFDPQMVIIGGGVAEIGALWWQPFERAFRQGTMPATQEVILRGACLGTDAVMIGASTLAWAQLL